MLSEVEIGINEQVETMPTKPNLRLSPNNSDNILNYVDDLKQVMNKNICHICSFLSFSG